MRFSSIALSCAAVAIAASCGGRVVVDGFSAEGTGGSGGAGSSSVNSTAHSTGAAPGPTSTGSVTPTTGSGTPSCSASICDGNGSACDCKGTCNGVPVEVQCGGTSPNVGCVCFKQGAPIAKCIEKGLVCDLVLSCCSQFLF